MSVSKNRNRPSLERLEVREVPAVQAFYDAGTLSVIGDAQANDILVKAASDGTLQVTDHGQNVAIQTLSGTANRSELTHVNIDGKGGNDRLITDKSLNTLDTNGVLVNAPTVTMLGGTGDDFLQVNSGGIVGGAAGIDANGVVVGQVVGDAFMDGGDGNDQLVSGFGNDVIRGGAGNDTYTWPPGTLSDKWDGGTGNDTVIIIGNDTFKGQPAGDAFKLTADPTTGHVLFQRTNLVQFSVDIANTENIVLKPGAGDDVVTIGDLTGAKSLKTVTVLAGDGNDTVDASAQKNASITLLVDGGNGDDVLTGGAGINVINGGAGNDTINGGTGANVLIGGDGNDSLTSNGKYDVLIGGSGADTFKLGEHGKALDFNAADGDVFA
jgi:Ca2+-binding RTX toxin-like protein